MGRTAAAPTLGALALTIVALTAACGGGSDPAGGRVAGVGSAASSSAVPLTPTKSASAKPAATTGPAVEPRTEEGVRRAALRLFTADAGGDYAGEWDLFVASARRLISRADYVHVQVACGGTGDGPTPRVTVVRPEGAGFVVSVDVGGTLVARTWQYEDGAWRMVPSDLALTNFRKGPTAWLADEREQGHCTQ